MSVSAAAPPPIWRAHDPLLLASMSATRLALLRAAGLAVEATGSGLDERALEATLPAGTPPAALAAALADAKASAVAARAPGRIVLGADQVVALDGEAIAKPASPDAARDQLARLSGRRHHLHAAATLVVDGEPRRVEDTATVALRDLSAHEVDAYVARMAAQGWAGGLYQVEGLGQHLVAALEGDHTTILGLPMRPLLAALRARGLIEL